MELYNLTMKVPLRSVNVVTALIKNSDNKVLLLKRNELAFRGYWQFPEGKTEAKESPKECLQREMQEELGESPMITSEIGQFPVSFNHPILTQFVSVVRHVYLVEAPSKISVSQEHSDFGWFSYKEASKLKLIPGVEEILNHYFKNPTGSRKQSLSKLKT